MNVLHIFSLFFFHEFHVNWTDGIYPNGTILCTSKTSRVVALNTLPPWDFCLYYVTPIVNYTHSKLQTGFLCFGQGGIQVFFRKTTICINHFTHVLYEFWSTPTWQWTAPGQVHQSVWHQGAVKDRPILWSLVISNKWNLSPKYCVSLSKASWPLLKHE